MVVIEGAGTAVVPLSVHVENGLGEVVVEVNKRYKTPSVQAYEIDEGGGRVRGKPQAWVAAEQIQSEGKTMLRVLALEQEGVKKPVYIRVRVPEGQGVSVKNAGGPVRLTGVSGPIEVQADAGEPGQWKRGASISVAMGAPVDSPISLFSADGEVELLMPAGSRGRLDVQAPHRLVVLDADGARVMGAKTSGETYSATLNEGTNPVIVSAKARGAEVRLK